MQTFERQQDIQKLLRTALECSFYLSPREPGLTYQELLAFGSRVALQPGEIGDALQRVTTMYFGKQSAKLLPKKDEMPIWHIFVHVEEPDYRNVQAFDFLYQQFIDSARMNGASQAKLERSLIVERAITHKIPELDIEAAIAISVFSEQFVEKDGLLQSRHPGAHFQLPSVALSQHNTMGRTFRNPARATAYPIVKDIIERRDDGRSVSAEPFDAFAEKLETLGYGPFRLWWKQLVAELRQTDVQNASTTVVVLAAALVEGSLAFVVKHARTLNQGVMGSKTFDDSPTRWRIDDLVSSASAGKDAAILDAQTKVRADGLVKARQRIHAGRVLVDHPDGPPDLRPEAAREAKATAEQVVRCVVDWLQRYPPA